ncbi:hypothetical protein RFI_28345 [Reticulomyxa filosa]|uniref:Uncharacterized protein n=1 Tax=Reticulomyxa filosa TaxID=46433 RepID=X6M5W9_RETFI|nr:hypothetical protein RFI_28345 [Reticulomyxa filosa]|eukprot:ETO09041.1 hypothetical protein RFI_28345 [Reticulomyxa filosa]
MPYNAFIYLEKEMHKVTLAFLRLKRLKEKVTVIIGTTNSKARDCIPFKIADNNGQYITSNRELRIAFKTKPVLFFIHFTHSFHINKKDNDDEKKYPKNEKKENEFRNIVEYKNLDTEIDKDALWNKANKKAHKMVNEMINNKQQGIVVVATNIDQLAKSNYQLPQHDVPFSLMINSNQYMKKKLIFGSYSVSSFHSKIVVFDNITIDGCIYAVDCIIDGFGNCHITQQLIPTNPSVIRCRFRSNVFTCPWPIDIDNLMELGKNSLDISKVNEAIQLFRFALCFKLQTLHDSHNSVALSYFWLGRSYKDKGEYDKAIEYYEKDLKISLITLGYDHIDIAVSYNSLGNVYKLKGEYDKAIEYHEKALKIKLNKLGPDHTSIAASYNNLGNAYENKGEYDKAVEYHEKSLKIKLNKLGPGHPDVAISYNNLGNIYQNKGKYDKAMEYHEKSLKIKLNKLGHDHIDVASSYDNLALAHCGKQEYDKAMEFGKKALDLRLKKLDSNHPDVGNSCHILGDINCKKGEKMEAMKCYENTMSIYTQKFGENHQKTQEIIWKKENFMLLLLLFFNFHKQSNEKNKLKNQIFRSFILLKCKSIIETLLGKNKELFSSSIKKIIAFCSFVRKII